MVPHFNFSEAQTLASEVADWAQSAEIVEGFKGSTSVYVYEYEDGMIPLEMKTITVWTECTDVRNENTAFTELMDVLGRAESASAALSMFGPKSLEEYLRIQRERIRSAIVASSTVDRIASNLLTGYGGETDLDESLEQVRSVIIDHLCVVIGTRVATLSKRYALTEAIFKAYKLGLLPFGWDWKSLWCLNPSDLDSPGAIVRADGPHD